MLNKFIKPKFDLLRLQKQLKDSGLPVENVRIAKDATLDYDWRISPTEEQFQQAAEIVANHDHTDKTVEKDTSIYEDIKNLSATKS